MKQSAKGCVLHIGKTIMAGARNIVFKHEPNGFLHCYVEALYDQETYQELSKMCFDSRREPLKIVNKKGETLNDFHYWSLLEGIETVLKLNDYIINNITFKLLNKIKG